MNPMKQENLMNQDQDVFAMREIAAAAKVKLDASPIDYFISFTDIHFIDDHLVLHSFHSFIR